MPSRADRSQLPQEFVGPSALPRRVTKRANHVSAPVASAFSSQNDFTTGCMQCIKSTDPLGVSPRKPGYNGRGPRSGDSH